MEYLIVVVDDETLSLTNAKNLLGEENMRVSCLRSGRDLIKFVEKNSPDLILLDILMPEMDGFETYSALRRYEDEAGKPHIPVIFLTGESGAEMERRGLKIGASDFIRKPFNRDVLLRRIHNTIINSKTIESLTEEATVDKLTGFLNKSSGTNRVSKLCESSTGALVIMDLDSFKLVNDLFGHDMGDRVLQVFSNILRHSTRERDVISRIGGDEFMAFFTDIMNENAVRSLSERLNSALAEEAARLMGEDYGIPLGISIGVVMVPEYGRDYDTLFALADSALYYVKQNGKHGFNVYDHTEMTKISEGGDLDNDLERMTRILEERDERGALLLGREAFAIAYRSSIRLCTEYGGEFTRVLFELLLRDGAGKKRLPEASSWFGYMLQRTLRKSDLIMQISTNQFYVLLNKRTQEEIEDELKGIVSEWENEEGGSDIAVKYAYRYVETKVEN